jgi:hypothetical protein
VLLVSVEAKLAVVAWVDLVVLVEVLHCFLCPPTVAGLELVQSNLGGVISCVMNRKSRCFARALGDSGRSWGCSSEPGPRGIMKVSAGVDSSAGGEEIGDSPWS